MAFGKALTIGSKNRREVSEFRARPAECLVDGHLLRRVREVVVAADDVRYAHERVVDCNGEVVNGHAELPRRGAGADEDGIGDCARLKCNRSAHNIVEGQRRIRDAQADGEDFCGGAAI